MKKIIIIILILLTGCDYKELNELAIVSSISISKNNNLYTTTLEITNSTKEKEEYLIYTGTGNSISDSLRQITKKYPKKLYLDHINILFIDEELAKKEIKNILDFFSRNTRNEFYILIDKSKNILSNNISSKDILESLKENKKHLGITNTITYNELINNYLNPNIDLAIPSIEFKNNEVILSTISIFKNNKLIDYLSDNDSVIYNLINNNINSIPLKITYPNNEYIDNEIINTKSTITIKNNIININIKGNAIIKEINYNCNLEDIKTIKSIEKRINTELKKEIETSIHKIINKYNTDIYGFKDLYYKNNPKYYNKIKNNWPKNIIINSTTNIKIIEKGYLNGDINVK